MGEVHGTATLAAARAHARAQEAAGEAELGPLPAGVDPAAVLVDDVLGAGCYLGCVLPRDAVVRVTDVQGDGCLALLALNAAQPAERLNVADTVKVQWQAYLGTGAVLLSDLGRVLLTVVADTSGRHDALCGQTTRESNAARYRSAEAGVGGGAPAGRDLLALAALKHGLSRRDVAAGVNLFKGVRVQADGELTLAAAPAPGAFVELRAEQRVLVLAANAPHPLDERADYTATPVRVTAWRARRPDPDPWRSTTPERRRAFERTEEAGL